MKRGLIFLFIFVFLALISEVAFADLKFKWGPYLRVRHEYWKNIYDFDNDKLDNRNFFRIKTSLWGQVDFDEKTSFLIKFSNENKAYTYWGVNSTGNKDNHYDINEGVFDNLYVDAKNIFGLPWDVRFGRQDFPISMYGEGFLFADAGPRDGSRTFYFNAAKFIWRIDSKNTLDFIALKAPKTDDILPVFNKQDGEQALNYGDDFAYVLYHKGDAINNLHWENYYIYKREGDDRPSPLTQKSTINTFGSYAKYSSAPWALRGQLAYQFGTYGTNDREAIGGYAYLDRDFKDVLWAPQLSLGYYYLSGDERASSKYEGFNELFSTYSWMSELYNLSFSNETGTSYWTNLQMWRIGLIANLTKKMKGMADYSFLRANESQTGVHSSIGRGRERGHLPRLRFDYAFNKNVTTYFLAEYFIPGDFYVDRSDKALFLRTEIQIKF